MLKQEQLIKNISDNLGILEYTTRNRGLIGLLDQNIIAESFIAKLLNIIYDYKLINLKKGCAAIDLGDDNKKTCFQVTYTCKGQSRGKIKKTIATFIENEFYKNFTCLKFLFLGPKQQKYKAFDTQIFFIFDPSKDVLNLEDLIKELRGLSSKKIIDLSNLIDEEFHCKGLQEGQIQHQNDSDALKEYRAVFDRPALLDSFQTEANYQDFEDALKELIQLLKTGSIKTGLVAKPSHKFDDKSLEKDLDNLYKKINALRQLYVTFRNNGEINPETNSTNFTSNDTPRAFNDLKQDVIHTMNLILIKNNINQIPY